jgi:hypothetical protein
LRSDFSHRFTGSLFLAAAIMLWLGWMLLPVKIGPFFEPDVFPRIDLQLRLWLWIYRVHLFGYVVTMMAFVALGALLVESRARVVVWPGIAVASAGMVVGALAAAFYYHHGVWGARQTAGKSAAEVQAFIDALRVDTEYVTCLVRFGRVFSGLGLVVIASGSCLATVLPRWLDGFAALIGLSAMAVTMGLPDRLELYEPIFHALAVWLTLAGIVILRGGARVDSMPGVAGRAA